MRRQQQSSNNKEDAEASAIKPRSSGNFKGAIAKHIRRLQRTRRVNKNSMESLRMNNSDDDEEEIATAALTPVTSKDEDHEDGEELVSSSYPLSAERARSPTLLTALDHASSRRPSMSIESRRAAQSSPNDVPRLPSLLMATPLGQKVRDLTALRRQAKAVRLRAGNIEERVEELQEQADAIFLALQQIDASLREENYVLQATMEELHDVEDKCMAAAKALQDEISIAREEEVDEMALHNTESQKLTTPSVEGEEQENEGARFDIPHHAAAFATVAATIAHTVYSAPTTNLSRPHMQSSPGRSRNTSMLPRYIDPSRASSAFLALTSNSTRSLQSAWTKEEDAEDFHTNGPTEQVSVERRHNARSKKYRRASSFNNVNLSEKQPQRQRKQIIQQSHQRTKLDSNPRPSGKRSDPLEFCKFFVTTQPKFTATSLGTHLTGNTYIRMKDLHVDLRGWSHASDSLITAFPDSKLCSRDLLLIEDMADLVIVLKQLAKLGLDTATDENEDRFQPTWETKRALKQNLAELTQDPLDWSYAPWYEVNNAEQVLIWCGSSQSTGFGHDLPMIKARGNIPNTTPRQLLDFLLDSIHVKRYNKMNISCENKQVFQSGVDTVDAEKDLEGDARIVRTISRHKLSNTTIESTTLQHAKSLPEGAFLIVSRSIWEHETIDTKNNNFIRNEVLLRVQLIRPIVAGCELTTVSHLFSPGVPELMAKRLAPSSEADLIKEIQSVFSNRKLAGGE